MSRPKTKDSVISHDPFDISSHHTPAQRWWSEWISNITDKIQGAIHPRSVHYKTLGILKPDGTPYDNTTNDGALLGDAILYARYLGNIAMDKIEDHKNEGLEVQTEYKTDIFDSEVHFSGALHTQTVDVSDILYDDSFEYHFDAQTRQPYHIEIWIEKSTLNNAIKPIAYKYHTSLMVAGGQFSLTNVHDCFQRIKDLKKPIRIFYLHDFDPAGMSMPKAVARKLEWFVRRLNPELDVKLFDLLLHNDQCIKYNLPRTPMKRDERYAGNFEAKYGKEGAVELDSLEALHPGKIAEILDDAIKPYFDSELSEEIWKCQSEEAARFRQYKAQIIEQNVDRIQPILNSMNELVIQYNSLGNEIRTIVQKSYCGNFEVYFPGNSYHKVDDTNNPECLLDTKLSYDEQLARYKAEVLK